MSLGELLERHRDCKRFRYVVNRLHYNGFRSYKYADRKLLEAYSILEKLKGKIPEKKMRGMEGAMMRLENEFEEAWLLGYLG